MDGVEDRLVAGDSTFIPLRDGSEGRMLALYQAAHGRGLPQNGRPEDEPGGSGCVLELGYELQFTHECDVFRIRKRAGFYGDVRVAAV